MQENMINVRETKFTSENTMTLLVTLLKSMHIYFLFKIVDGRGIYMEQHRATVQPHRVKRPTKAKSVL